MYVRTLKHHLLMSFYNGTIKEELLTDSFPINKHSLSSCNLNNSALKFDAYNIKGNKNMQNKIEKRQPIGWEKISINDIFDKQLLSRIYRELL